MFASRLRSLSLALALAVLAGVPGWGPAAQAEEPLYVDWASLLPGLSDEYDPGSANDCVAGRLSCITAAVKEMERRFRPLAEDCSHDAVFAMTYLRITQTYRWSAEQPGYYEDVRWMNHAVAVFAKYYLRAFDAWRSGDLAAVPQAWRTAFAAARDREVAASGNLMLGINAHINRDLAFAMAAAGLVGPDGTSKKANFDKVNVVLNSATVPLMAELAARFDPSLADSGTPYHLDSAATGNLMFGWREQAWRNAEALTRAPDEAARDVVAAEIEANSILQANTWYASAAYLPLSGSGKRDAFCAVHHWDPAPEPYPFGAPTGP